MTSEMVRLLGMHICIWGVCVALAGIGLSLIEILDPP